MTIRRAALTLGLLLVGLAALFAVPGNGIFESGRHQGVGTVLSHTAMLMALWGAGPTLVRWLDGLPDVDGRTLGGALAIIVVVPTVALGVVRLAGPHATHQLVTREWGLLEPLQAALYLTALWLCVFVRRALADDPRARTIYRTGAVIASVLLLEEIDYLGILTLLVRLAGAPEGRIGRKHIGGLHDVVDAWTHYAGIGVVALAALVVAGIVWVRLGHYRAAILRELRHASAIPLTVSAGTLLLAQIIDLDDSLLPRVPRLGLLEEPLEIGAALALNAALLLRLREARLGRPVSILAPGRRG
jgi:hypothetical protein